MTQSMPSRRTPNVSHTSSRSSGRVAVTTIVVISVVYDGESTWLEGVALIGLYGIIATAFWWG